MKRNYELSVTAEFCAAHKLNGYPGNCRNVHGHNWGVTVNVLATDLDKLGMGMDFREIKVMVKEALSSLDHAFLNDLAPFAEQNPTAENLARHLYTELNHLLAQTVAAKVKEGGSRDSTLRVSRITVAETPGASVTYWEDH